MNKYKIAKDIDVEKSTSTMGIQAIPANLVKVGALANPFIAAPMVGAKMLGDYMLKDIKVISTLEELDTFSCIDDEWDRKCIYVEHPRIAKRLIDARIYKDYILKELMSEIFDYITDNIAVKKIVLGLESKGKVEAGAAVPINKLVADASFTGYLNSNYMCAMEDVDCTGESNKEYSWLRYYPDIVSAVKKNTGKLELRQSVKMNLEVNLGIQGALKGAFTSEKEYNFYVYWEKA